MNWVFAAILGALCTSGGFLAGWYARENDLRKYGR